MLQVRPPQSPFPSLRPPPPRQVVFLTLFKAGLVAPPFFVFLHPGPSVWAPSQTPIWFPAHGTVLLVTMELPLPPFDSNPFPPPYDPMSC